MKISSPDGPTTVAVCGPRMIGRGVMPWRAIGQRGRRHAEHHLEILAIGVDAGAVARIEQPVFGADHQIFLVLVVARKAVELEGAAGEQAAHGADGGDALVRRLDFLAPDRRQAVAAADLQMGAGLAVVLAGGLLVAEGLRRLAPSGRRRAS